MIVLLPRPIKQGMRGPDVVAIKRALSEAGYGTWLGMLFTQLFGPYSVILLKRFQKEHGLKQDGVYGSTTHKKLAKYYDLYGAKLMNDYYHKIQETPAQKVVAALLEIYNYCRVTHNGVYTQDSRRMSIVRNRWKPPFKHTLFEDCSSSATAGFGIAFNFNPAFDPNRLGFNGWGYTGTMSVHGIRVAHAILAACGFYGNYPYKHVVVVIGFRSDGTALVFSWGSGLPAIRVWNYRGDFSHWRQYV